MTKQWRVVIPEQQPFEKGEQTCSAWCPFLCDSGAGAECNLHLGIEREGAYVTAPGPDCPGPGVYLLVREEGA